MPGFNVGGLGLAGMPSNTIETRRMQRWVFQTLSRGSGQFSSLELLVLKTASRPKYKFVDTKMDHNQETAKFAGKIEWEPIELVWYDTEQAPDVSKGIYQWFETVQDNTTANVGHPSTYKGTGVLAMLSGMNAVTEQWTLYGTWPSEGDWKGLDYTSSEIAQISVKMTYDRAVRGCNNNASVQATSPSC